MGELKEQVAELAENFDREARANFDLRDRHDYDDELFAQYDSAARAFRTAANMTWRLVQP